MRQTAISLRLYNYKQTYVISPLTKMSVLRLFVLIISASCATLAVDLTVDENARGADVVLATVFKIEDANIFPTDKRLLRRIAYVETSDGERPPSQLDHGGIWKVSSENFLITQTLNDQYLIDARLHINTVFSNELRSSNVRRWEDLEWEDLNRPLWSGLAARLFVYYVVNLEELTIPTSSDIEGQAQFWKTYYNMDGDIDKFIDDVKQLEKVEGCKIKSDLIFVLDTSGSVGSYHFQEVLNFTIAFVELLDIGPDANQVGVILFGTFGYPIFNLSDYKDKESLLEAISNITYRGGSTNTADGLCLMLEGFSKESGARLDQDDVFRLAIVMTDGQSNQQSVNCYNGSTTLEVAEKVHNASDPILVFSIGVTGGVNQEELEAIATRDEYVTYLSDFNEELFKETTDEQTYELCVKSTIPVAIGQLEGTLEMGGTVRYELEIPEEGVTIRLCVYEGIIIFYGSYTVSTPNEALYDYKYEVISTDTVSCEDAFVPPMSTTDNIEQFKRQTESSGNFSTFYILLEGVGEENEFVLETSEGDNREQDDTTNDDLVIVIMVIVAVVLLLLTTILLITAFLIVRKKEHKVV